MQKIDIFSEVYDLLGEINESFKGFKKSEAVEVNINTIGGDIFEGIAVYNFLKAKRKDGWKINTNGFGLVASAGTVIFLAGENRRAYTGTQFLLHEVQSGAWGTSKDLHSIAEEVDKLNEVITNIYKNELKLNEDEIRVLLDLDTFMSSEEAKQIGLVTEILKIEAVAKLLKNQYNMGILEKIKKQLKNEATEFEVALADGKNITVKSENGELSVGAEVKDEDGNVLPDGSYTTLEGEVIKVEGGKIIEIDVEPKPNETEEEVAEALNLVVEAIAELKKELVNLKRNVKSVDTKVSQYENKGLGGNAKKSIHEITAELKAKMKKN